MKTAFIGMVGLSLANIAAAQTINIGNVSNAFSSGLGAFTGTLSYVPQTSSLGVLSITLTNTSPEANGGFITGFVFDVAGADPLGAGTLATTTNSSFLNTGNEPGNPYGTFDAGAALGASFLGGGSPNVGIAIGASATFTFNITAFDAGSLTSASFLGTEAEPGFIVRLRGFNNGGSDKVPAWVRTPTGGGGQGGGATVPLPSAALAAGGTLLLTLGAGAMSRRRRAQQ